MKERRKDGEWCKIHNRDRSSCGFYMNEEYHGHIPDPKGLSQRRETLETRVRRIIENPNLTEQQKREEIARILAD